jgi:glycerol-3-phosphate dehydrogenase (NAD(P)+)
MTKIAILGGGSWGSGLSVVLANSRRSHDIALWVREPAVAQSIKTDRENKTYLPISSLASYLPHMLAKFSRKRFRTFRPKPSS